MAVATNMGSGVGVPVVVAQTVCWAAMAAAVTAFAGVGVLVTTNHSGVLVGGGGPVAMGVLGGGPTSGLLVALTRLALLSWALARLRLAGARRPTA